MTLQTVKIYNILGLLTHVETFDNSNKRVHWVEGFLAYAKIFDKHCRIVQEQLADDVIVLRRYH
jgi:hypothetical protein